MGAVSGARLVAAIFPARYGVGAWLPTAAASGGFIALEAAMHARHGVGAVPAGDSLALMWEGLYSAGYLTYLAPLALPSLRQEAGFIRRALVGFGFQLMLGGMWFLLGPDWAKLEPCLLVANGVYVAAIFSRRLAWVRESSAAAGVAALALATLASNRHDGVDVAVGAAIGWSAFRLSVSSSLAVLASEDLLHAVRFHLSNLKGVLLGNPVSFWQETYSAGDWDFLDSRPQRGRHYAIAGMLRERFPAGPRVLDVGCGLGTLRRALGDGAPYVGLDISAEAIERARTTHQRSGARFVQADFLAHADAGVYDAVVLNEMLYYLPLGRVSEAVRKAARLSGPGGVVIVSMHQNPKVPAVWETLNSIAQPVQEVEVRDPVSGSSWAIRVYEAATFAPAERPCPAVSRGELRREQGLTALCLAVGLAAGFYFIDAAAAARAAAGMPTWAPATPWDGFIPFSEVWIWPYLLYFPLCLTPLLLDQVRSDRETFRGAARGFLLQFAAAFAVFLLIPSGVSLPVPAGEGLSAEALRLLHRLDPGFNVFPSLHVANAVYVASLFSRFSGGATAAVVWVGALLVTVSTVLVKQHYLADLPAGAGLGAAAFFLSFPASRPAPSVSGTRRPWLRASFAASFALVSAAMGGVLSASTGAAVGFGHLAAVVALFLAWAGGPAAGWTAAGAFATAVLLIRPENAPAAVFGAVSGAAAWALAFWEQMIFLDDQAPLVRLRHQIDEALNVFVRSDAGRWDRMYAGGQWEFLRGGELAPLYAAAAEFLRHGAPSGARIVDLGCGNGALLPSIRGWHQGYLGVDLSQAALARARLAGLRPDEDMRVQPVEEFEDFSRFEAAVFNEVLYYLPVERAVQSVRAAVENLQAPGAVVVVMTDNPKARLIWAGLDSWRKPLERRVFRVIRNEPPCELRLYVNRVDARD